TPYSVYASVFGLLLARHGGQQDFGVGTIWANRQEAGLAGTAGFLVNTLPLRFDLRDGPTFAGLLADTSRRTLGLMRHQDVPLTEVVRCAATDRTDGENPLFRALFNYRAQQRLVLLGEGDDAYLAQQSIRTFFNTSHPDKHYVKTAMSVLNMGFMRGLSAAYMEATPAINDWLAQLIAGDEVFRAARFS
ncbi:hypothetical protein B5181_38910, partial [Streptomyces sp. 4F]